MGSECEHLDGALMGKCAICENMVCSECFQTLFNAMICSAHEDLEDESEWELIGFHTSSSASEKGIWCSSMLSSSSNRCGTRSISKAA